MQVGREPLMTKKCAQRIGNFLRAVMLGLKIAKMKIALGSKMSELTTSVFKGEKQFSTIMPFSALTTFMLLLQFSCFHYVNVARGILLAGNNLD